MENVAFEQLKFKAFSNESVIVNETVKQYCPHPKDILELGCGTGANLFAISELFPDVKIIGVDISKDNIELAHADIIKKRLDNTISAETINYLHFGKGPFDIIYAESVMHLIAADNAALYAKLSQDLRRNGLLVVTMPYHCLTNTILISFKKLLKLFKNKHLDNFILKIAKVLYPKIDANILKDRIPYMYIIPYRIDSKKFRDLLQNKYQLKSIQSEICKSTSIAKLRHKMIIFQKTSE